MPTTRVGITLKYNLTVYRKEGILTVYRKEGILTVYRKEGILTVYRKEGAYGSETRRVSTLNGEAVLRGTLVPRNIILS
jgi:hypothetical protein